MAQGEKPPLKEWDPFSDFGTAMEEAGFRMSDCEPVKGLGPWGEVQYKIKSSGPHFTIPFLGQLWDVTVKIFSNGGVTGTMKSHGGSIAELPIHDTDTDVVLWQNGAQRITPPSKKVS